MKNKIESYMDGDSPNEGAAWTQNKKAQHTPGRLYYHKTDGGAEYLCGKPVDGTTEGDLHFAAVRLDGKPELLREYAAPDLLNILKLAAIALIAATSRANRAGDDTVATMYREIGDKVRAAIAKAEIVNRGDGEIGEANAALIAAAPDLLAACQKIAALADGQGRMNMIEVAGMARAALSKATGE